MERDLFGEVIPSCSALRLDGQRRKLGYAERPGTGPKRQRCNTCRHAQFVRSATRHAWKCSEVPHVWDDTPATDIKPSAPACRQWERRPFK